MSDPGDEHQNKFDATEMSTHRNWEENMPLVGDNDHDDSFPTTNETIETFPVPTPLDHYKAMVDAGKFLKTLSTQPNAQPIIQQLAKDILENYPDQWNCDWIIGNSVQWTYHVHLIDNDGDSADMAFARKMSLSAVQFVPHLGGWIFWDEAGVNSHGPFTSYKEAEKNCDEYVKTLG